jgi:phosphoribosylglycinamide formyltransferase-1
MITGAGQKKRVGVLISGRGSNMQALVEASRGADYPAEIALVVSNRVDAAGLDWAGSHGIVTKVVDHKAFASRAEFDAELGRQLAAANIELVALAGFMRIMTADLVNQWRGRMINIHPSLLPLFPGLDTHRRALDAGVKIAGCTVHFVTPEMDVGPIIAQAAVPIVAGDTADTLARRVLTAEHRVYAQALAWVARGEVTFDGAERERYGSCDNEACLMSPGAA